MEKELILEMFFQDRIRAVELFLGYSEQENEDSFIDAKEEASIDKPIQNEIDARLFIADFLREKNICLDDLKVKRNVVLRESLIIELKNRSNLSVRQMANLLDLDRNIVQRTK